MDPKDSEEMGQTDVQSRDEEQVVRAYDQPGIRPSTWRVVPNLIARQYRALLESIIVYGVQVPIVIDEHGTIIDGYHRWRAAVWAKRRDIPFTIVPGLSEAGKRELARRLNLARRHPGPSQRRQIVEEQLRERPDLSSRAVGRLLGVDHKTASKARKRLEAAGEIPVVTTVTDEHGKQKQPVQKSRAIHCRSIAEAQRAIRDATEFGDDPIPTSANDARSMAKAAAKHKKDRLDDEDLARYLAERYSGELEIDSVRREDIRKLDLPEGSVDLIYTDPQYHEDHLETYEALAELASRVLKPGCLLFVYCGKQFLPDVIQRLGSHLDYVWTMADVFETGDHVVDSVRVKEKYRTILVYKRPGETPKRVLVPDAVHSPKQKDDHDWQNSCEAARTYIEAYTRPGDVVLDPFVGGGTVPAVCVELNRHFLAFDADPNAVKRTLRRLERMSGDAGDDVGDPEGDEDDPDDGGPAGTPPPDYGLPEFDSPISPFAWGGETPAEVVAARNALVCPSDGGTGDYEHLTMDEIDALPAGPLTVSWRSPQLVDFHKADRWVASIPVKRANLKTFFHAEGSIKSEGAVPVLNGLSNGCGRRLTGHANCDQRCFQGPGKCSGCYADVNQYSIREENRAKGWGIVHNGFITTPDDTVNDCLKLRLPGDGKPGHLTDLMANSGPFDPPMVRTDCVSSDGSLSLSLGLIQAWSEQNPSVPFYTISSDYFSPSDEMLRWAASIPTLWVGHTLSPWFSEIENETRLAAIRRHLDFGVPTVVWITTSPDWDNWSIAERALELVPPTHIIEAPLQTSKLSKHLPLLHLNPLGACGDMRYDGDGRLATFVECKGKQVAHVVGEDGLERAKGHVSPRCRGCRVKCGYYAVRGMVEAAAAEAPVWVPQAADAGLMGGAAPLVQPLPGAHTLEIRDQVVVTGDCLRVLSEYPDGSISVVVTSPPYNLNKDYGSVGDDRPMAEYLDWMEEVSAELARVLSPDGSLFLNLGIVPSRPWLADDVVARFRDHFVRQNTFAWVHSLHDGERTRGQFSPISSPRFVNRTWDPVYHLTKTGRVELDRLAVGVPQEDPRNAERFEGSQDIHCGGDTWFIPYERKTSRAKDKGRHPCLFPVELVRRCLLLHGVDRIRLALDPFLGSGTTLVAARRLGIPAVGIELDPDFAEKARERVAETEVERTPAEPTIPAKRAVERGDGTRRSVRRSGTQGDSAANETDALGQRTHVWVDTTQVTPLPSRTLVDLFCGAGGIGEGFGQAGFRSIFAVEMDEDAAATYQTNFPHCDLVLADIRDLTDDEILCRIGGVKVDVVSAGWPCQGMSSAGKRNPADPRNLLYREAVRVVRLLRPHVVVMENVPELLDGRNRGLLEGLLSSLGDAGYPDASVMLLDAADYGVPQRRLRAITIANRDGLPNPYPLPLLTPDHHVTAREAIDDLLLRPNDPWTNHTPARHNAETKADLASIRAGGSGYERSRQARRPLDPDAPAPTATYCHGNGFVHYAENRIITPLEYARLQGFPDEHVFEGGKGSVGGQICNAVPPPLARCIALAVQSLLDEVGE
jgi:DNA-cytosine methyltransferase